MKFATILVTLSTGLLATASVFPRDGATILNDISIISSDAQKVYNDVQVFEGGSNGTNQAVTIQSDANTLDAAIKNGTTDAQASNQLSDSDSASVANAVVGLQSTVFALLDALTAKKNLFGSASLGFNAIPLVESSLANQRQDTLDFGSNVTAKLSPVLQKLSPLITYNIDFHLVRAVQAFSTGS